MRRSAARATNSGRMAILRFHERAVLQVRGRAAERKLVTRLVEEIRQRLDDATGVAGETEAQFLEFGKLVRSLAEASDRLVARSRNVIEIALGRDGGDQALADIVDLLRRSLGAEAGESEATGRLIAELSQSAARMNDVQDVQDGIAHTMAVMRVVGVMFRTESARLPDEVRGLFLDLAAHIATLETEVEESFGSRFRTVEETRRTLAQAIEDIEREARKRARKALATRQVLERSLDTMAGQIERNRSREVDLLGLSRRMSQEAERVVMGLQTHDIISQKLAHIGQALERIREKAASGADGDVLREFHEFCKVEAGQLRGVNRDLQGAFTSIDAAVRAIRQQVDTVDDDGGLLSRFADATGTSADMVQVLLDAFADLRSMIGDSASAAKSSRQAVQPILQALGGLNAAMTSVALKLGLVALNAQVLAVQRGQGTGLEVLAARAARIAADAESLGERVSVAAEEVANRIAKVAEGFERTEGEMGSEAAKLDCGGGVHELKLHAMRDQMLACLQDLGGAVDDIRAVITQLGSNTSVLTQPLGRLDAARRALEEMAQTLQGATFRELDDPGCGEWDGWLQERYTMASERKVHQAIVVGEAATAGATESAGEVELF